MMVNKHFSLMNQLLLHHFSNIDFFCIFIKGRDDAHHDFFFHYNDVG